MLTAYQCETVAYRTEDWELLCYNCFDNGADFACPVSRFALEEELNGPEECDCFDPISCSRCDEELMEGYTCEEHEEGA